MEKLLLTPVQAAETLSICRSKLYELISSGRLQSVRIDGSRRIPIQALDDFVAALQRDDRESSDLVVASRIRQP